MTSFGEPTPSQPVSEGETIGQLYLRAERSTARKVVTKHRADGADKADKRWVEMPSWRFYRQVVRVGLYLRERLHVEPGDRVALLSPLRTERIVADWAAVVQGAVVATLDTRLPPETVGHALTQLAPKVTFVSGPAEQASLLQLSHSGAQVGAVIAFDSPPAAGGAAKAAPSEAKRSNADTWAEVLDLGGTLDTAERALKFRAWARSVTPDAPALAYTEGSNGTTEWRFLTQGEVLRRIDDFAPRPGDVAYVAAPHLPLSTLLSLRAFVGDGRTTVVIGTPGREVEEIAELGPNVLIAPSDIIERAVAPRRLRDSAQDLARTWLKRIRSLGPLRPLRTPQNAADGECLRDIMTLDGTRVVPRNRTTGDAP